MDPAIQAMLQAMMASSTQTYQVLQQLATNQAAMRPSTPFPKWDGKDNTVPIVLAHFQTYKSDP